MEHWWTSLEVARGLKNQPEWLNSSSKKSLKNPEKHLKNQGSFISRLQEQIIIFSDKKKKKLMILWMCFLKWLITDHKFFKECDFFLKELKLFLSLANHFLLHIFSMATLLLEIVPDVLGENEFTKYEAYFSLFFHLFKNDAFQITSSLHKKLFALANIMLFYN